MASISLSVVIPTYNEGKNIVGVVEEHAAVLSKGHPAVRDWEIVCLDDASTDDTLRLLQEASARIPRLRVVQHTKNMGIYQSFADLFHEAKGDYIFATGGDGQWPAQNLVYLLDKMQETSADLVVGVRKNRAEVYSLWRQALSHGFNWASVLFFGIQTHDANGIKLGRKDIFTAKLKSRSFFAEIERIIEARKKGYAIAFAPVDFCSRSEGKSRGARWANISAAVKDLIKYRLKRV